MMVLVSNLERGRHFMDQKEVIIQEISGFFKVLGDKTRLSLLFLLEEESRNVSELAQALGMEQSAVSHQLKVLKNAKIVKSTRQGKSNYYSLDDDHIFTLLEQVRDHIQEDA